MSYHERGDDYFLALASAVYADDLVKARGVLAEMHAIGIRSRLIRAARQTVDPLPHSELAHAIALPVTGDTLDPFRFDRRPPWAAGRRA